MKNRMRKLLSLSLAAVVAISMTACGVGGAAATGAAAEAEESTEEAVETFAEPAAETETEPAADADEPAHYTVGICQLVQHVALDAATQGLKDAIIAKLGEDTVTFDEQNAAGDSAQCTTICTGFVSDGVDLMLANATPALQAAAY